MGCFLGSSKLLWVESYCGL